MRQQVFISHASEDRPAAQQMCEALEAFGLSCWIAFRDIPPGASYSRAIMDAIGASHSLLVVVSSRTSGSFHVLREVERAADRGLLLAPVRIEDASPGADLEYFLSTVQWIDAFPSLTGSVIARIAASLQAAAGMPARAAAATASAPAPRIDSRAIRVRMLSARSRQELRRLALELDVQLRHVPHDADALMLKDDLERALQHENSRGVAMDAPSAAAPARRTTGRWITAAAGVIAVAGMTFIVSQANRTSPTEGSSPAAVTTAAPVEPAMNASATVLAMLPAIEARAETRSFETAYEEVRLAVERHAPNRTFRSFRTLAFEYDGVAYGMHFFGDEPRFLVMTAIDGRSMSIYVPRLSGGETRDPMALWVAMIASPLGGTNLRSLDPGESQAAYELTLAAWAARSGQFPR